ncbi:hypothetical protein FOH10_01435 [Nocardia otitidiscaviarum]|uniref:Uncharacterized protein n=1 Tax=Nocardia otitidiscaviarum TaxID=1823 RepID=A0A516NFF8_9NOCA|nr:hypothetical protein [Nocardia otitidiscaviarum]MCP9622922.1 hypothetical protein [Nocardia otitidiscaviarum]QDP77607.1 hypothetical protein FOH10_01435 [Nocardia otitidiscaviarum]
MSFEIGERRAVTYSTGMRCQRQPYLIHLVLGGATALGVLTGCGSGESSADEQASPVTCAEFLRMSSAEQFDAVERAVQNKPGWQLEAAEGDGPSMALRAATTMVTKNCSLPDAAERTVAESVRIPSTTP